MISNLPMLYFYKRSRTEEERSKIPQNYEEWEKSVIETRWYEQSKITLEGLAERYKQYHELVIQSNLAIITVEKFAATGEKSFIETFNKILEKYPDATLLGEGFQEWWELNGHKTV